jgi:heat shock protein HslJ
VKNAPLACAVHSKLASDWLRFCFVGDVGGCVQRKVLRYLCRVAAIVAAVAMSGAVTASAVADNSFPFGQDLLLDAQPMKGSKRVPVVEIDEDGTAIIDLWCDRVEGRAEVSGDSITITPVARGGAACPPDRAQADDDMIEALQQVTGWRRSASGVVLIGPRALNFRLPTN